MAERLGRRQVLPADIVLATIDFFISYSGANGDVERVAAPATGDEERRRASTA